MDLMILDLNVVEGMIAAILFSCYQISIDYRAMQLKQNGDESGILADIVWQRDAILRKF